MYIRTEWLASANMIYSHIECLNELASLAFSILRNKARWLLWSFTIKFTSQQHLSQISSLHAQLRPPWKWHVQHVCQPVNGLRKVLLRSPYTDISSYAIRELGVLVFERITRKGGKSWPVLRSYTTDLDSWLYLFPTMALFLLSVCGLAIT